MSAIRECVQCGAVFRPKREHARFCSARCRMAWNRRHGGIPAAPTVAIGWSATAMSEAVGRFAWIPSPDLSRAAAALSEAVWWITLVDATLVRYHPRDYDIALSRLGHVLRRKTEETLAGLRYVRNQIGHSTDPEELIQPGADGAWNWTRLPEPLLPDSPADTHQWELDRYLAYKSRLAGRNAARSFACCASFLEQAAAAAIADDTSPATANSTPLTTRSPRTRRTDGSRYGPRRRCAR